MYWAVLTSLVALLGLDGLRRAKRRGVFADVGAIACVLVAYLIVARCLTMAYVLALAQNHCPDWLLAAAGMTAAIMLFYGLSKRWPTDTALGFAVPGLARSVSLGVVVGCTLAVAFTRITSNLGATHYTFGGLLVCSNLVPVSVLEEAIFRGRMMEILLSHVSADRALLLQAVIFAAAHIGGFLFFLKGPGWAFIIKQLVVVFIAGYAFGLLRVRTGNLWASTVAHVVYNILVLLDTASV